MTKTFYTGITPPSNEEISKAHKKVIARIKNNYENRDISPLTLHNAVHSFEAYFLQYTEWMQALPTVVLDPGAITFRWITPSSSLEISCQGPTFRARYCGKDIGLWSRRDKIMEKIAEKAKGHKFPIDPC